MSITTTDTCNNNNNRAVRESETSVEFVEGRRVKRLLEVREVNSSFTAANISK